jgi:hypothetical protein
MEQECKRLLLLLLLLLYLAVHGTAAQGNFEDTARLQPHTQGGAEI